MLNSIIYTERNVKMAIFQSIANKYKDFKFKMKTHHPSSLEELKALVEDPRVKLSKIDVSKVESFEGLFKNSTRTDFSGIEKWDVSHVTNMRQMFYNCKNFNADISKWNVSNVSAMAQMFYNCKEFSQDLHSWDMSGMKGHLNGQFLSNMFKNADKMTQRVIDAYVELGKQNIPPEERFSKLPIPRPKDYKKLVVPHTDSDVKEMFERIEDFANMDTSAVHNLDGVLKETKKKELKNGEALDFSNVKSANDFLKDAKNFNMNFTFDKGWRDLKYANNFMSGTDAYNQPVPPMPNVCQMDHFMADNKNFKNDLHSGLKDSKPKFADESFNKVDHVHMVRETSKLSKKHAVTKEFAERLNKAISSCLKDGGTNDSVNKYEEITRSEITHKVGNSNLIYLQMPTQTFNELKRKAPNFPGIEFFNVSKDRYSLTNYKDPLIKEKIKNEPEILNTSFVVINEDDYKDFLNKNKSLKVHNPLASIDDKPIALRNAIHSGGDWWHLQFKVIDSTHVHSSKTWGTIHFTNPFMDNNNENIFERAFVMLEKNPNNFLEKANDKQEAALNYSLNQIYYNDSDIFMMNVPEKSLINPNSSYMQNMYKDFKKYVNSRNNEILKKDNSVKNEVKTSKSHGR